MSLKPRPGWVVRGGAIPDWLQVHIPGLLVKLKSHFRSPAMRTDVGGYWISPCLPRVVVHSISLFLLLLPVDLAFNGLDDWPNLAWLTLTFWDNISGAQVTILIHVRRGCMKIGGFWFSDRREVFSRGSVCIFEIQSFLWVLFSGPCYPEDSQLVWPPSQIVPECVCPCTHTGPCTHTHPCVWTHTSMHTRNFEILILPNSQTSLNS